MGCFGGALNHCFNIKLFVMAKRSLLDFLIHRLRLLEDVGEDLVAGNLPVSKFLFYKALVSQSTVSQTSGVLVEGHTYLIKSVETGDDFTNVGFAVPGVAFEATGTTPTVWTNESVVIDVTLSAPVARVLNKDDVNYLGDIVWSYSDVGEYLMSFEGVASTLCQKLVQPVSLPLSGYAFVKVSDDVAALHTTAPNGTKTDGLLVNTSVDVVMRKRGGAPVLVGAETNETGDQIILTFDKDMGWVTPGYAGGFELVTGGQVSTGVAVTGPKELTITLDSAVSFGDEDTLSYTYAAGYDIESAGYGLLESFEGFPLVNNVPES